MHQGKRKRDREGFSTGEMWRSNEANANHLVTDFRAQDMGLCSFRDSLMVFLMRFHNGLRDSSMDSLMRFFP
jgi:hypothetical protein